MLRKAWVAFLFSLVLCFTGLARSPAGLLDVYIAKVKPGKRAEFDAVSKKMAYANRHHDGDQWVALESMYGELNTVVFTSARENYAGVETGMKAFEGSIGKALGMAGALNLEQQFNGTLASAVNQTRTRRWDLSYNPPADRAAYAQAVGNARYLRSIIVQVRPGHSMDFEAALKDLNAASQKTNQPGARWVSQVTNGGSPWTYVLTRLFTSWGELDSGASMKELLGDEGYMKFQKMTADSIESVDYQIFRIVPEISNPPAEVIAVAPDFWNPKPKPGAPVEKKEPENKK